MGRLITPISQEEYDRLPRWQQWMVDHPVLGMLVIQAICLIITVVFVLITL